MEQTWDHDAHWDDPASAGPPPAPWHDDGHGCDSWASQHHYDAAAVSQGGDSCDSWASERHPAIGAADDCADSCNSSGSDPRPDDGAMHGDDQSYRSFASERHRDVAELACDSDSRDVFRPELHHDSTDADDGASSDDHSVALERHHAPGSEAYGEHRCNSEASHAAYAAEVTRSEASTDTADTGAYASTEGDARDVSSVATASIDHAPPAAVIRGSSGVRMAAGTDSDSGPEPVFTIDIKSQESGINSDATTEADEQDCSADARASQPEAEAAAAWPSDEQPMPAAPVPQRLHIEVDSAHALFRRNPGVRLNAAWRVNSSIWSLTQ